MADKSIWGKISNAGRGKDFNSKNGFDKFKNVINSKAVQTARKIKQVAISALKIIGNILSFIFSPIGLITTILLVLVLVIYSGSYILGPIQFSNVCNENGTPKIEGLKGKERNGAMYGYFEERLGISREAAVYIAKLEDKNGYGNIEGVNKENCDLDCLIEIALNPDKKEKLKIGAFGLSGDDAYELLMKAKDMGKDWKDPAVQLDMVAEKISNSGVDKVNILKDPMQSEKAIKTIAEIFERTLSNTELNNIKKEVKKEADKTKDDKNEIKCVTMGSGLGKSRIHGGSAYDTSGGLYANFEGLDFTDIVTFMNSFATDKPVHPPIIGYKNGKPIYGTGPENANSEYIAAKRKAEKNSTKDSDVYWASCDRFVATVVKAMEIDVNFPWGGAANQITYMKNSKCWGEVNLNDIESGDIVGWNPAGKNVYDNHGHVGIYADNHFYEASYGWKYPHKWRADKAAIIRHIQEDPRPASVFRYKATEPGCEIKRTEEKTDEKIIDGLKEEVGKDDKKEP